MKGTKGVADMQTDPPENQNGGSGMGKLLAVALAVLSLAGVFAGVFALTNVCAPALQKAAEISARLTLPQGGRALFAAAQGSLSEKDVPGGMTENDTDSGKAVSAASGAEASSRAASSAPASASAASSGPKSAASSGLLPVRTLQMGPLSNDSYATYNGLCVYNQTAHHSADIQNQLAIRPDVHIGKKSGPQVLIIHTHTTESYASTDSGTYSSSDPTRTTDRSKSVCRVGDEIASVLNKAGISTVHDTTYHDYPEYPGAYTRALTTLTADLKKYPSVQVVLDVHRDAIQYDDGTRVKPTAVVNGKKAAQVMIVAPCDEEGTALSIPGWQYNYRFALRVQQSLLGRFPTLARPLNLCPRRYNMQVCHGSLLVEVGTDVNTLDEAIYGGHLFAEALATTLNSLKG